MEPIQQTPCSTEGGTLLSMAAMVTVSHLAQMIAPSSLAGQDLADGTRWSCWSFAFSARRPGCPLGDHPEGAAEPVRLQAAPEFARCGTAKDENEAMDAAVEPCGPTRAGPEDIIETLGEDPSGAIWEDYRPHLADIGFRRT